MGQLIKLQDYVSRYEQNIYNYPSRFVRLKKQQWDKLLVNYNNGNIQLSGQFDETDQQLLIDELADSETLFTKMKNLLKFNKNKELDNYKEELEVDDVNESEISVERMMNFSPTFTSMPQSTEMLKQQYLDQLFRFQLKWASSTLFEKSIVQERFYVEPLLKYFLQRFPDNILVLYKPIFLLKKAPVEAEIILITPTEVLCISIIEKVDEAVFVGSNDNFWEMRFAQQQEKVLNPILSVNRMGNIVTELFNHYEVDLPIRKIVLSRNGYIDYPSPPFDINFVEKRNYDEWFYKLRSLSSPIKHVQLKAANYLLQHCQTTSYRRLAWEDDETINNLE